MVTSFKTKRSCYSAGMVITHVMLALVLSSLGRIFIYANESANGAGIIHWLALVTCLMGLASQATVLITQLIEDLS